MHILVISADPALAHAPTETFLSDVAKRQLALAEMVDSLVCVVRCNRGKGVEQWSQGKLQVFPTQSCSKLAQLPQALFLAERLLRNEQFDLIHVQDPFELGMLGLVLSTRHHLPLLVDLHADFINNPWWLAESFLNRLRHPIAVWVLRRADGVRITARSMDRLLQQLGIHPSRIHYLPGGGGSDVSTIALLHPKVTQIRQRLLGAKGKHIVLFVGRLVPQKDLRTWLKVAQYVTSRESGCLFVIVGDGPERKKLEGLATRWGISQSIHFTGRISHADVPAWMQAADVLLLTSTYEGASWVRIEAAAAGKPVVTTCAGGAHDVVIDNVTGFVVPIKDAVSAGERVVTLLQNPELRERMGSAGQAHVFQNFNRLNEWPKMVDIWRTVIVNCQKPRSGVAL